MNASQPSGENKSASRRKLYFSIALILLLVLSIVWSIDTSFVYILSGISFYFFYSAFRLRDQKLDPKSFRSNPEMPLGETPRFSPLPNSNPVRKFVFTSSRQIMVVVVITLSIVFLFLYAFIDDDSSDTFLSYQKAEEFYGKGEYDSALIYYRRFFQIRRDYPGSLLGYGNALMMTEQYDSAIIMYDEALKIDEHEEQAFYQKGLVLYYKKDYEKSIEELKALLDINPDYHEAQQTIGDGFYNRQQYDSALTWYEKAYTSGLRNRYLCHLMAYIYDTKGKSEKAIDLYKEALKYDDSIVDIYVRLGELLPGDEGNPYRTKAEELKNR